MAQIKRETAVLCKISDILKGSFVKTEGWNPSYFSTEYGKLSRVSIIGVVLNKEDNGLVIDDGSGKILLRSFDSVSLDFSIGCVILVVGRPRVYNEQKYIVPEIVKQTDQRWGVYNQLRINNIRKGIKTQKVEQEEIKVVVDEKSEAANHFQKILGFIKDLDSSDGADTEEVIKRSEVSDADKIIQKLIEEGEIFEMRPGKLKILI